MASYLLSFYINDQYYITYKGENKLVEIIVKEENVEQMKDFIANTCGAVRFEAIAIKH